MWNKMRLECVFIIVEGCASLVCVEWMHMHVQVKIKGLSL
jgi:hypothetical protein